MIGEGGILVTIRIRPAGPTYEPGAYYHDTQITYPGESSPSLRATGARPDYAAAVREALEDARAALENAKEIGHYFCRGVRNDSTAS